MYPLAICALAGTVGLLPTTPQTAGIPTAPPPRPAMSEPSSSMSEEELRTLHRSARELIARHAQEGKSSYLEKAWNAVTTVLASPTNAPEPKAAALTTVIELAPLLRGDLVRAWLAQYVAQNPDSGLKMLRAIGESMAQEPWNSSRRIKLLKLQAIGAEALLTKTPQAIAEHGSLLTTLSNAWLREASHVTTVTVVQPRRTPGMPPTPMSTNSPSVFEVLDSAPSEKWLAAVDPTTRSRLLEALTKTHLVADQEEEAFACIEQQAAVNPDKAKQDVQVFFQAWIRSRNPNEGRPVSPQQPVMANGAIINPRASGIPLTRSRQERNLKDLANYTARLRKLTMEMPDEALLAQAFTSCHSSTEVFHKESLDAVFGSSTRLKPQTLARLAQQMRTNLNSIWRMPNPQGRPRVSPTRRPEDLQAEILRGYATARALLDDAQAQSTTDWQLALARAAVMFDELDYRQEVEPTPEFTRRRAEVMAEFARAARLYAATVEDLAENAQNDQVFDNWFMAALGASDLQRLTEDKLPDPRQAAAIRAALLALPGDAADNHLGRFAGNLLARLPMVKPAMKYRYLRMGAEVAAGHPRTGEAKRLLEYYDDLVQEIKLEATIDGSPAVGDGQPFGVFVSLRHTKEIERESGGFGRYLQNQSGVQYGYNYGRPLANYRDRFQAAATASLEEHFEIVSCTFETDKVVSRPTVENGWRVTPYAYLLLKARGPQVDRLPPLQLDLDFFDATGVVVLPIESPAVPLTAARRDPRPAEKLEIIQTLDDRRASQGDIRLEIKATARGLVPDLGDLLTVKSTGFEVVKVDGQPASVNKFDPDAVKPAVVSERTWLVSFKATPKAESPIFQFPTATIPDAIVKLQRYQDADIVPAATEISLAGIGHARSWWRFGYIGGAGVVVVGLILLARRWQKRTSQVPVQRMLPDPLTPFSAHGFLDSISRDAALPETQRRDVRQSMRLIEQYYFAQAGNTTAATPDLQRLLSAWVGGPS